MDDVYTAVREQVKAQLMEVAQEQAALAIRYGLAFVGDLIEQRTGQSAIPSNVWNAIAPVVGELAASSMDGSLLGPDGKLDRQVRAQFEARITTVLDEFGFLQRF